MRRRACHCTGLPAQPHLGGPHPPAGRRGAAQPAPPRASRGVHPQSLALPCCGPTGCRQGPSASSQEESPAGGCCLPYPASRHQTLLQSPARPAAPRRRPRWRQPRHRPGRCGRCRCCHCRCCWCRRPATKPLLQGEAAHFAGQLSAVDLECKCKCNSVVSQARHPPTVMLQGWATWPEERKATAGGWASTVEPWGKTKEASGRPFSSAALRAGAPAPPAATCRRACRLLLLQ